MNDRPGDRINTTIDSLAKDLLAFGLIASPVAAREFATSLVILGGWKRMLDMPTMLISADHGGVYWIDDETLRYAPILKSGVVEWSHAVDVETTEPQLRREHRRVIHALRGNPPLARPGFADQAHDLSGRDGQALARSTALILS
jgi:hypothetical protein